MRHAGATRDEKRSGEWVDLSKHTYYFPEVLSGFTQGRKRSPAVKTSRAAEESARKHGPAYSSDESGDGPSSSAASSMHNGVELLNSACLKHWKDFCMSLIHI